MVSDVEIEEDQRVPSNPKCESSSPLQTMPIDLSVKSRRTQQTSEICPTTALELASRHEQLRLQSSLLFGHFTMPNTIDIFGTLSLFDRNLRFPSTSTRCSPIVKLNKTYDKTTKATTDRESNDEGGGYVIIPTTGNRCKRNYKNVTIEKR